MDKIRFMELLTNDLAGEITAGELRELIYLRGEPNYDGKEEELLRAFWVNSREDGYESSGLFQIIQQRIADLFTHFKRDQLVAGHLTIAETSCKEIELSLNDSACPFLNQIIQYKQRNNNLT